MTHNEKKKSRTTSEEMKVQDMAEKGTLRHHVLSRLSDRARAKQTKSTTTQPQLPPRRKKEGQQSEHSNRPEQRPKARDGKRRASHVETENSGGAQKGAWEGGLFLILIND